MNKTGFALLTLAVTAAWFLWPGRGEDEPARPRAATGAPPSALAGAPHSPPAGKGLP